MVNQKQAKVKRPLATQRIDGTYLISVREVWKERRWGGEDKVDFIDPTLEKFTRYISSISADRHRKQEEGRRAPWLCLLQHLQLSTKLHLKPSRHM